MLTPKIKTQFHSHLMMVMCIFVSMRMKIFISQNHLSNSKKEPYAKATIMIIINSFMLVMMKVLLESMILKKELFHGPPLLIRRMLFGVYNQQREKILWLVPIMAIFLFLRLNLV